MKKCWLILGFFLLGFGASAQKIQYSRQTFPSTFADAMQMVAGVNGSYHLLCFTANKKPEVYVFNAGLQLQAKTDIEVKLNENCDVNVVSFATHYFLYLHVPGSSLHQLFRIDGEGIATNVSHLFSAAADSSWNRSTATFQLFADSGRLALVSHTYFDALKKIGSRIVFFSGDLLSSTVNTVFLPFDKDRETLQQMQLAKPNMVLLKTVRSEERGAVLEVVKANISSGTAVSNSFASGSHFFVGPAFRYNAADSSLLVYSMIREQRSSANVLRPVFLVHLDHRLQEAMPPVLLRSQFRKNLAANFLLPAYSHAGWLQVAGAVRIRAGGGGATRIDLSGTNLSAYQVPSLNQRIDGNFPSGVRFTLLNERFEAVKDSTIANNGNIYDVQPYPSAQFVLKRKACLLLIENFSSKRRGLLLVTASPKNELMFESIRVFDRYEYLLPLAQPAGGNAFVLPYTYKNEIGLVKISLDD